MTGEVEFSSLTKEDVKIKLEQPDRVPRRPSEEEVAKHRKTRLVLVIFFGIVVLAMVVAAVIIIIVSPKCAKVEEGKPDNKEGQETDEETWWRREIVYQIYPRSFKDSNKDGNGDLKGIADKMQYLKDLGVKIIRLDSIYGPESFTTVNNMFGSMADFEGLLKKSDELGIKVVLDFVPNYTSDKHPWFVESSKASNNSKRDWYIWREGKPAGNLSGNSSKPAAPPNNWISVYGGSAWKREGNSFYLHQFSEGQPDLNLANPAVISALKDAMKFWLDKGIDGFAFENVQFMVEDSSFKDEPENPNYNATVLQYDMLDHKYTYDLDQDREILKQFTDFIKNSTNGSSLVSMAEVTGSSKRTIQYYSVSDFPFNIGLIPTTAAPNKSLSESISESISGYLKAFPKGESPNWLTGSEDSDRVKKEMNKAMNVLLLTLPGTASTYYGEEIGMVNSGAGKDASRSPMQWSSDISAGFTEGKPWSPVGTDFATVNVEEEGKKNGSTYSLYKSLVGLRAKDAFNCTCFELRKVDEQVLAYTRGDLAYLVIINFSDQIWEDKIKKLSGRGKIVVDTEDKDVGKEQDVNHIELNPGQALVLELDQQFTKVVS